MTTTAANGLSTTTKVDANGVEDGSGAAIFNVVTTDVTTLTAIDGSTVDGSRTETVISTASNNTIISKIVTSTSADRQTITTKRYLNETTTPTDIDQSESVQTQADGSVSDTITTFGPTNARLGTVVKSTSGNGLSQTTTYEDANGTAVDTQSCTITLAADGDKLMDCGDTDHVNGTSYTSSVRTQTSGNGQRTTITTSLGVGAATIFSAIATDTIAIDDNGVTTETIADTITTPNSVNDTTTITTLADKLNTTTLTTLAGAAKAYIKDDKTKKLDGSTEEVTTYLKPSDQSTIEMQTTVDTSFDGRTI